MVAIMRKGAWTKDQIDSLKSMARNKLTDKQIGRNLRRPPSAVFRQAERLGITLRTSAKIAAARKTPAVARRSRIAGARKAKVATA